MCVTNKGKKWETIKSWWILITFITGFHFIAFFYAGYKVNKKQWTYIGVGYLIAFYGLVAFVSAGDNIMMIMTTISAISWIGCIVHAFLIRKEYLVRLEAVEDEESLQYHDLRTRVRSEHNIQADFEKGVPQRGRFSNRRPMQEQAIEEPRAEEKTSDRMRKYKNS